MATGMKRKPAQTLRAGEQAVKLFEPDATALQPRLEAGTVEGLAEDNGKLANRTAGATAARTKKEASTQEQNQKAQKLGITVQAVRNAMRTRRVDKDVRKATGVGRKMNSKSVTSVVGAAKLIVDAYVDSPEALRSAGVLPKDVEKIADLRDGLMSVDSVQEGKKVTSKLSTAARNVVQRRVEEALRKIVAAAEMEFALTNPERLAMYRALLPKTPKKRKPTT